MVIVMVVIAVEWVTLQSSVFRINALPCDWTPPLACGHVESSAPSLSCWSFGASSHVILVAIEHSRLFQCILSHSSRDFMSLPSSALLSVPTLAGPCCMTCPNFSSVCQVILVKRKYHILIENITKKFEIWKVSILNLTFELCNKNKLWRKISCC